MKELVSNWQEMLLIGAGVHTKIFKDKGDEVRQLQLVMSNRHLDDLNVVIRFFEDQQSQYVKRVDVISQGYKKVKSSGQKDDL